VLIERILRYLLSANEVKKPRSAPQAYLTHYDFCTSILRVSKTLRDIGTPIFHANRFILVSTNDQDIVQIAKNNLLPLWQSKLERFKSYHLRLNILHRITPRGDYAFLLICSEDLETLLNSVKMKFLTIDDQRASYRWPYSWTIEVKARIDGTRLPLAVQMSLLEPFKKIRYREQRCIVRGEVDTTISAELPAAMSPSVLWRRADEIGALYKLVCWQYLALDKLIQSKEWLAANLFVRNLETFIDGCHTFCQDIKQGDDTALEFEFCTIGGCIKNNRLVIELNLASSYESQTTMRALMRRVLKDTLRHVPATSPNSHPTVELVCGLCHLGLGEFALCWERLDRIHALGLDGKDMGLSSCVKEFERGLPTRHRQQRWCPTSNALRTYVQVMVKLVRASPMGRGYSVAYTPKVGTVALERYMLKAMNYTGDMLEEGSESQTQSFASDPKYVFDPKAADRVIARYKKELADAAANGRKHVIDIGPKPVEFDPYSPHTVYRPGVGFEHFRDGKYKVNEHGAVLPMVDVPERPPRW